MYLARKGLEEFRSKLTDLVPAIYAWEAANPSDLNHLGWILMEYKAGIPLDTLFPTFTNSDKEAIFEQIADIFSSIQRTPLPKTLSSYGGLTINEAG